MSHEGPEGPHFVNVEGARGPHFVNPHEYHLITRTRMGRHWHQNSYWNRDQDRNRDRDRDRNLDRNQYQNGDEDGY